MLIDLLQLKNSISFKFNNDRSIKGLRVSFEVNFKASVEIRRLCRGFQFYSGLAPELAVSRDAV